MIDLTCMRCGESFKAWPSKRHQKYCNKACYDAAQKGRKSYVRTPEHREKMRAKFKGRAPLWPNIEAAAAARRGVPPSDKARQIASERWSGPGNPNYRNGTDGGPYGRRYAPGFSRKVRRAVIERDRVCADCREWDDGPRRMQVHHIDGSRHNHALDNLVLLCIRCHHARHVAIREAEAA